MLQHRPILLVEDDMVDILTVERAMAEIGLNNPLKVVANGMEALEYLDNRENEVPCMILLDLNMPKMTGIEFLQELDSRREIKKFPVIVLTTSNENRDVSRSFQYGVAGYIVKPLDYKQFVETVKMISSYWNTSLIPE